MTEKTKKISAISNTIDAIPGIAPNSPETTRLIAGTAEISRSTLRIRSERKIDSDPLEGSNAIATTKKSNILQGSRQNPRKSAKSLKANSRTKIPRNTASIRDNQLPATSVAVLLVSRANMIELTMIRHRIIDSKCGQSSSRFTCLFNADIAMQWSIGLASN